MESIPVSCTGWLLFSSRCFKVDTYKIHTLFRMQWRGKGAPQRQKKRKKHMRRLCFILDTEMESLHVRLAEP